MKIGIVNVVGIEGSTGKIATKLAGRYKSFGHECKVFHGRGKSCNDGIHIKHGCYMDNILHYLRAKYTGKEGYYSTYFTKKILNDIYIYRPDIVIILNLHGHWLNIPLFLNEISKLETRIKWFMCDEYPYTGRCEYTKGCERFKNHCLGCDRYDNVDKQYSDKEAYYSKLLEKTRFFSVPYIVKRAKTSSLLKNARFECINTGIDTDYYCPVEADYFKKKYKINEDKVILLDVAPFSNQRKGVNMFIDAAKLLRKNKRYVFVNIGYDGKKIDLPNFIGIPYVSNQKELRDIYASADMYVCTSTDDALPNACVEAMSCGTPITAFNISGMPYLAKPPILTLIEDISSQGIADSLSRIEKKTEELVSVCRREAVERYKFSDFADAILT